MAAALGRPARLFPFPPSLMRFAGKLFGKSDAVERLVGSLTIDSSKIHRELGWKPPYTMEQGLKETAEWFKEKMLTQSRKERLKAFISTIFLTYTCLPSNLCVGGRYGKSKISDVY